MLEGFALSMRDEARAQLRSDLDRALEANTAALDALSMGDTRMAAEQLRISTQRLLSVTGRLP